MNENEEIEQEESKAILRAKTAMKNMTDMIKEENNLKLILDTIKCSTDNKELLEYIKMEEELRSIEEDMDNYKKGELYLALLDYPSDLKPETEYVKFQVTRPYMKLNIDKDKFIEDYGPQTEEYKKYVKNTTAKGNIKFVIKDDVK